MTDWGWQYVLEVGNGILAIVTAWLSGFLIFHVAKVGSQRGIWRRRGWSRLPQALQLAVAMLAMSTMTCVVASLIWLDRYLGGAYLVIRGTETVIISIARIGLILGCLCALRVTTRPMLRRWPWLGAIGSAGLFLAWSILRLF